MNDNIFLRWKNRVATIEGEECGAKVEVGLLWAGWSVLNKLPFGLFLGFKLKGSKGVSLGMN